MIFCFILSCDVAYLFILFYCFIFKNTILYFIILYTMLSCIVLFYIIYYIPIVDYAHLLHIYIYIYI